MTPLAGARRSGINAVESRAEWRSTARCAGCVFVTVQRAIGEKVRTTQIEFSPLLDQSTTHEVFANDSPHARYAARRFATRPFARDVRREGFSIMRPATYLCNTLAIKV